MADDPTAGALRIDAEGNIEGADATAQRILGRDPAGTPLAQLLGEDQDAVGWGDRLQVERDGTKIPISVAWRAAGGGKWLLRIRDISAKKRAQERVRRSEAQLREAQEIADIGSWVWDIQRDQITWSDELYRIYGLEPQSFEATFEAYMERIHPDDKEMANAVVQKAFQDHGPFSFDHRIIRAGDEEVRWLHGQGAVDVEDGKPVRMYGISQDVTEQRLAEELKRKALEKELEAEHYKKLDHERTRLLNTMAHELNTPITPLRLQVKLLEEEIMGPLTDKQSQAVHVIDQNVNRLSVLLQDILDVARLQSAKLKLRKEPCDVRRIVDETIETFAAQADTDGISLSADGLQSAVLEADAARLTQVLHNLVSNALKFTPAGGKVEVRVDGDAEGLTLEVQDSGPGLTEEQIGRLFRPFSQVHDDPGKPGTGLGLHICKGIAQEHGGSIEAESDGPGKGCTFRLRIPGRIQVAASA